MTIEAIAVDIDGTITDDTRKICISAITALRKAEKQEYRIPIEGIYLHYKGIPEQTTNVENITQQESIHKILRNGQLIIIKNNKIYNILGHEITEKY